MNSNEMIEENKIFAIIRGVHPDHIAPLLQALYDGGIRIAEITLNSPNAMTCINNMSKVFEGKMLIGAGTVLNKQDAINAIQAGASFLVCPILDKEVILTANEHGIVVIPGAMTPTEIVRAIDYGADYVKVFPAGNLGPSYIKQIIAPLDNLKAIAVGGVNSDNAKDFLESGAIGLGVGGSLINMEYIEKLEFKKIRFETEQFVKSLI